MKQTTYIILLSMIFTSCLVTKKYTRPELEISEAYRDVTLKDSTSLAEMPWNEFFTDPTLKDLINEALENNFDLLMAYQRVLAAEALFKQGKAEYMPTLSANLGVAENKMSNQSWMQGLSFEEYSLKGSLTWEPDIWGRITANKNAAKATLFQVQEDTKAIQTALVANLASAYFQLIKADAQIDLMHKTIANRKESFEVMMELKKSGRVNEAGVMQTKAQLHSTEALLVDFNRMQMLLENTINLMLGREYADIKRSQLNDINTDKSVETGVPALLLANRPDVRAAEFRLMQAFEQTNVARTSFYPNISISASGGLQAMDPSLWFNKDALLYNAAANLTQPIFNKRRNRTALEVAKAQQEQAFIDFKKSITGASTQVSDALINYQAATEKYKVKSDELEALNKAVTYSEDLLTSGFATYLEVLIAQNSELNAEINIIDIKVSKLTSMISIYEALGGGWRN
ncbi:efflux transporter outer membrane subunit [Saccharicrinis aurantiacus]|uniref:efflux transporter outer membrane subunit n=1 Tax=Saccharicrinis aurantiacus TaxID=1849719 RepID=UPI00248FA328|nr:TolC family protein [Saccharicrinis aurantiacus]